jgi:hypothetical protein
MTPASAIEVVAAKIAQLFVLLLGMTGLALTVARLYPVALAHGDLADAAGRLRGYRGIVAFDPAAHGDHARLTFRPARKKCHTPKPARLAKNWSRKFSSVRSFPQRSLHRWLSHRRPPSSPFL